MDFLSGHLNSVIIFLLILLVIVISNLLYLRPLPPLKEDYKKESGTSLPLISVLIPARNEEINIRNCIESVMKQDYPSLEIIVLDDNSNDSTALILEEIANGKTAHRLSIIRGESLPEGWVGKTRACYQLSKNASGELLLFIDADTELKPKAISTAAAKMFEGEYELLSLMPRQKMVTLSEKLIVPVILWSIMLFMPLTLAYRLKTPYLAAAVGQFMMFRASAYKRLGGHKAVKDEVVDDLNLAKHFKKNKARWGLFNGVKLLSCRMYRNTGQVYEGFVKNLFGVFNYRLLPHFFIWLWVANIFILPVLLILLKLREEFFTVTYSIPEELQYKAFLAVVISLCIWLAVNLNFRIPLFLTFVYPVTVLLVTSLAMISVYSYVRGKRFWKGRVIKYSAVRWW